MVDVKVGGNIHVADSIKEQTSFETIESELDIVLVNVKKMLLEKNRRYGDSALNPLQVFCKADPIVQIHARMDDKLKRIKNQQEDEDEDAHLDLLGYLILEQIALMRKEKEGSIWKAVL